MMVINNFLDFYRVDPRHSLASNNLLSYFQNNWNILRLPHQDGENPGISLAKKIIFFIPSVTPGLLFGLGERCIDPQRYYFRQWRDLSLPLEEGRSVCFQVAKKIICCIYLLLPTMISVLVGFMGVAMKACSGFPAFEQESRMRHNAALEEMLGPHAVNNALRIIPRIGQNPFQSFAIGKDVTIKIATFLTGKELLALRCVSKEMKSVTDDPIPWQKTLEDNRIWGPSRYWKGIVGLGSVPAPAHPRIQLQEYFENGRHKRGFMDMLIRNYSGGPVGFRDLPRMNIPSPQALNAVKPEDMAFSVMRGGDLHPEALFIRLIDRAVEGAIPIVLIFTNNWTQVPNEYWKEGNLLDPENRDAHAGYILCLINGTDFSPTDDLRLRRQVQLA